MPRRRSVVRGSLMSRLRVAGCASSLLIPWIIGDAQNPVGPYLWSASPWCHFRYARLSAKTILSSLQPNHYIMRPGVATGGLFPRLLDDDQAWDDLHAADPVLACSWHAKTRVADSGKRALVHQLFDKTGHARITRAPVFDGVEAAGAEVVVEQGLEGERRQSAEVRGIVYYDVKSRGAGR